MVGGTLLSSLPVGSSAYVRGGDTLKVALIGCGSRGAGAARDALQTDGPVELVAMADVFRDQLDTTYNNLMGIEAIRDRIKVPEEHKFVGLDAYHDAIELADVVLLVTPPAFRPVHFEAAVKANKHVFMEKPLASDAPGVRKILAAGKSAEEKGLSVVVGLQRRYSSEYNEIVKRLQDGAIGTITTSRCNRMSGPITQVSRQPGQSELEYQLRNWRHFCWLWAGSPAALTIHVTDIAHWAIGAYPVRAFGIGGRSALNGPEHGDIYDNFYIEYEYTDGTIMHSRTRNSANTWSDINCVFHGTEGTASASGRGRSEIRNRKGDVVWRYQGDNGLNPFQVEHNVFFDSIRNGKPKSDTQRGAYSTMADILGRMVVHSGQHIEWDEALNSELVLVPDHMTFDSVPPVLPLENGHYPIPTPGQTKVL